MGYDYGLTTDLDQLRQVCACVCVCVCVCPMKERSVRVNSSLPRQFSNKFLTVHRIKTYIILKMHHNDTRSSDKSRVAHNSVHTLQGLQEKRTTLLSPTKHRQQRHQPARSQSPKHLVAVDQRTAPEIKLTYMDMGLKQQEEQTDLGFVGLFSVFQYSARPD